MARKFLEEDNQPKTEYFSSGSTLLDCALGGGYAVGRVVNIVGDRSTGKTLLAEEACACFLMNRPKAAVYYNEVEAAFDESYARNIGIPVDEINFVDDCYTVEDFYNHVDTTVSAMPDEEPCLYVLDSLDALSDNAELARKIDQGTYGAAKARLMSEYFRRLNKKLSKKRVTLAVVSQVRENIGVAFGRATKRSGGKALDFYASQVIYLHQKGRIERQRKGIKRPVGIDIKVTIDKNKVGTPFRTVELAMYFNYGIDEYETNYNWLDSVKHEEAGSLPKPTKLDTVSDDEYFELCNITATMVRERWAELEDEFRPKRRKYGATQ